MEEDKKREKLYYPIFDRKGKAAYFLDKDKIHIYAWDGTPVAFVEKGTVFNFKKKHLGFYDEGWLRDQEGKCVGFAEPGRMGPLLPRTRAPAEPPAEKKDLPIKPELKDLPARAPRRPVWSLISDQEFFKGKKTKKAPAKKAKARKKK